jgi:DNA-binding GntR family transcriptional regulator
MTSRKINPASKTSRTARSSKQPAKAQHGTSLVTAFRDIRELIVHGKMSPGTWIVESDVAERLNMSRTPVRAAIQRLQREGYIVEHRNVAKSRMVVAPLTKEDATELYTIVGHTEGIAGRNLAQMPAATRAEIAAKLTALNEKLLAIAEGRGGKPGEIFELDRSFHQLIVEAGAGPRLATLHAAIIPQTERYWRLYASSIINDLHLSVVEHANVIAGVVAGDADAVERGLQQNWIKGAVRLGRVIDIFGERGSW